MSEREEKYAILRAKVLARFEGHDYRPDGPPCFVWHLYHDALVTVLTEPVVNRVDYILCKKSANEIPVRLGWLWPVETELPVRFVKACTDYVKADADHDKAGVDYVKARADYDKARADHDKARADHDKARVDYDKAGVDYDKARADYDKAGVDYSKAGIDCSKAGIDCRSGLEAIHSRELPGCPWDGERLVFDEDFDEEGAKGL